MSSVGKKGRRIRKMQRSHDVNAHHICYQRRAWSTGYAYLIRHAFIREVPVKIHDDLHRHYLKDVPVPPEHLLEEAWREYQEHRYEIDQYDICRAIAWLYVHIPDRAFRQAMQTQLDFFTLNLDPE